MGARGVTLSLVYRLTLTALSMIGGLLFFFDKDKVTREDMAREVAEEEKEEAALDDEMGADSDEKRGEDPDSHVAE
jgi:hypothetical protein